MRAALHARDSVPAYRSFLKERGWKDQPLLPAAERLGLLPETDKASYIKRYSTAERCLNGAVPSSKLEIDESSGSSGTPFSWVRSSKELHEVHLILSEMARYLVGKEHVVTLNAFSMGAWATGTNVSVALKRNGIIKSTGPDPEKILSALDLLGPAHTYVVAGYPPFLRELLKFGDEHSFDWRRYRMFGFVGGEGMTERLRDLLEQRFLAVYSAYGASDLDIGVAAEFPLSVWIRKRATENRDLARALFGDDPRLPMLFQYDPLSYYVETNGTGELVTTVNRLVMLSPRIRYNIHDSGGARSFDEVISICRDFSLDPVPEVTAQSRKQPFRLPFLWIHGRSDSTLSYMGANIYPEDVEQALMEGATDDRLTGGFCLELIQGPDGESKPCVHVETGAASVDDAGLVEQLSTRVRDRLIRNSRDFKTAVAENPQTGEILVKLHAPGSGPFKDSAGRLKRRYVIK